MSEQRAHPGICRPFASLPLSERLDAYQQTAEILEDHGRDWIVIRIDDLMHLMGQGA